MTIILVCMGCCSFFIVGVAFGWWVESRTAQASADKHMMALSILAARESNQNQGWVDWSHDWMKRNGMEL